jgi:CTP:phosphocholine cytidylyltransferase-like protein
MLKKCVEIEFVLDNKQIYWDDIPLFLHADEFELGVTPISKEDITEIDSFEELKIIDASYNKYGEEK